MSARQREFARHFVLNGGNATKAAVMAGYSASDPSVAGHRCLLHPAILAEIRRLSIVNVASFLPIAIRVLIELMCDPETPARDRISAANSLLDRGGMAAPKGGVQVNVGVQVNGNEVQALIGSIWDAKSAKVGDLSGIPPAMTDTIGALEHDENGFGEPIDGGGDADERVPAPVSSIPLPTATASSFTGFLVVGAGVDQEDGDGLFE